LRLVLVGLAVWALSRLISTEDVSRARVLIARVGWPLGWVLLPTAVALGLDAAGWRFILVTLGYRVPWLRMLTLRLSVEALVLALPGGSVAGEVAKVALLDRRGGVPPARGAASLALTKACLFTTDAVYLGVAAVLVSTSTWAARNGASTPAPNWPVTLAVAGAVLTAVLGLGMFALLRDASLGARLADLLARIPIRRLQRWIESQRPGFADLDAAAGDFFAAPTSMRVRCLIPFALEWLVEGAETILILWLLGVPLGIKELLVLDALGSLLRAIVFFVPAGLGIQDAATIVLMKALGASDPIAQGAAYIFIKRTKEVFWVVAGFSLLAANRDLWRSSKR
jgi:uncharacterized membrane protein YbhN (UPF0104 family)